MKFLKILKSLGCKKLTYLDLSGCHKITNQTLYYLSQNSFELSSLIMICCFEITDEGIAQLVTGCKKLSTLNFAFCHKLSGDCLTSLASLKTLKKLDLYLCTQISEVQIRDFKSKNLNVILK